MKLFLFLNHLIRGLGRYMKPAYAPIVFFLFLISPYFSFGEMTPPPSSPTVKSGCEYDYPPYCLVTEEGEADGFSVELLRAALEAMGTGGT